jgi:ubiquinone/menaquinone biosynthesis C-methylase UbiE
LSNEHFNLIAGYYDKTARFNVSDALLRALELPTDGILLDAGGGTGRVAAALRNHSGLPLVADISMGMLHYAKGKDLACVDAPVEILPFATGSIDRIIMMDALHHVRDQKLAITELYRVLKHGGRFVLIEPDIHKFGVKLIALGEKILLMRSKFLSGTQIADLFSYLGADIKTEYVEHNVWVIIGK